MIPISDYEVPVLFIYLSGGCWVLVCKDLAGELVICPDVSTEVRSDTDVEGVDNIGVAIEGGECFVDDHIRDQLRGKPFLYLRGGVYEGVRGKVVVNHGAGHRELSLHLVRSCHANEIRDGDLSGKAVLIEKGGVGKLSDVIIAADVQLVGKEDQVKMGGPDKGIGGNGLSLGSIDPRHRL